MKVCERLEKKINNISKPPLVDIINKSKLKEVQEDYKHMKRMCKQVEYLCPLNFCKEIEKKYKL